MWWLLLCQLVFLILLLNFYPIHYLLLLCIWCFEAVSSVSQEYKWRSGKIGFLIPSWHMVIEIWLPDMCSKQASHQAFSPPWMPLFLMHNYVSFTCSSLVLYSVLYWAVYIFLLNSENMSEYPLFFSLVWTHHPHLICKYCYVNNLDPDAVWVVWIIKIKGIRVVSTLRAPSFSFPLRIMSLAWILAIPESLRAFFWCF